MPRIHFRAQQSCLSIVNFLVAIGAESTTDLDLNSRYLFRDSAATRIGLVYCSTDYETLYETAYTLRSTREMIDRGMMIARITAAAIAIHPREIARRFRVKISG